MSTAPTILITGASSGIGKTTAHRFHDEGWNVVATMRRPDAETELTALDHVLVAALDVTDEASIADAVAAGTERFGAIDALLNNAGYGAYGPLEATSMDKVRRQFDTNVIGLLATTKAVLPQMRERRSGTIVNVSSIGGRMAFPMGTLYHGTKWAVEGLSEALHFELEAIGVKMKIIEPGIIATDFSGRSFDFSNDESLVEYQEMIGALLGGFGTGEPSPPSVVADVIFDAVTDGSDQLRYRAGDDAVELLDSRATLDEATFIAGLKTRLGLPTAEGSSS